MLAGVVICGKPDRGGVKERLEGCAGGERQGIRTYEKSSYGYACAYCECGRHGLGFVD